MKNYKKTKAASAAALLLAIMLTASACGTNANSNNNNSNTDPNAAGSPEAGVNEQLPENGGIQDPGSLGSDNESKEPQESAATGGGTDSSGPADIIMSNTGTYTGQIDSNSIEIRTDEGAEPYRIPQELAPLIEELPEEAIVEFEYTEKVIDSEQGVKQLWLTKIEVQS